MEVPFPRDRHERRRAPQHLRTRRGIPSKSYPAWTAPPLSPSGHPHPAVHVPSARNQSDPSARVAIGTATKVPGYPLLLLLNGRPPVSVSEKWFGSGPRALASRNVPRPGDPDQRPRPRPLETTVTAPGNLPSVSPARPPVFLGGTGLDCYTYKQCSFTWKAALSRPSRSMF